MPRRPGVDCRGTVRASGGRLSRDVAGYSDENAASGALTSLVAPVRVYSGPVRSSRDSRDRNALTVDDVGCSERSQLSYPSNLPGRRRHTSIPFVHLHGRFSADER